MLYIRHPGIQPTPVVMEPKATLSSGHSDTLLRRFPPIQPTLAHSIRSLSSPTLFLYQAPLPVPVFDQTTLEYIWNAPPIYIHDDDIDDVIKEDEFLGPTWRVLTEGLALPLLTYIHLGSRIVFKGIDAEDVSYFVIGCRLVRGSVGYIDIYPLKRGDPKALSNSILWPPFTMTVPLQLIDPSMKLNSQSQVRVGADLEEGSVRDAEGTPVDVNITGTGLPLDYLKGFFRDIYSTIRGCLTL